MSVGKIQMLDGLVSTHCYICGGWFLNKHQVIVLFAWSGGGFCVSFSMALPKKSGPVFTTLHFLRNLQMGPMSLSVAITVGLKGSRVTNTLNI